MSEVIKNGKRLRSGFTTGSCAAAAAAVATETLLSGQRVQTVSIVLPDGSSAVFAPYSIAFEREAVIAGIKKDAGDDPDVTNGMEILAKASFAGDHSAVRITGGKGVGVVTKAGLACPVGQAAINPVPQKMIEENVRRVCQTHRYEGGIEIEICAVDGKTVAEQTFNPRLGIQGGISILGTTGIVEPMSEKALVDTIHVLIDQAKTRDSQSILITPGNYGSAYCKEALGLWLTQGVQCSNFVGETLDYLVLSGFSEALFVGHAGKLFKIAAGVMNTHSSIADARMEVLAAHSAMAGAGAQTVRQIMECGTTDAAAAILREQGLERAVYASILEKMREHIDLRTKGRLIVELIVFGDANTVLCETPDARTLAKKISDRTGKDH